MAPTNYCWSCIRPVNKKLDCVCGLSWHLKCVTSVSHSIRLVNGENGLKVFETVCPQCIATEADKKKWRSGENFQPISKEVFNELLQFILSEIKEGAPSAFNWSASSFSECGRKTIDIKLIEKRIKEKYYESPKCFLNDVYLIHHNLSVMVENSHRFPRRPVSTRSQLDQFKRFIENKMRLLIDCPHCVHNYRDDHYSWLIMPCPWGHPLILASIKGKYQFAKMLKFNRESKRVDVILLASGDRDRVDSDQCWIPSSSDLLIRSFDGTEARRVKNLVNSYINKMKRKFKMQFSNERKPLTSLRTDFIEKPLLAVSITEDEVIDLIDDDEPIASNDVFNADFSENRIKLDLQKGKDDSSKKENGSPCEESSNGSCNGDIVIDEVGGDSPEERDTDSNVANTPSLTTVIDKLSNSTIISQSADVSISPSTSATTSATATTSTSTVPQSQINLSTLDTKTNLKVTKTPISSPSHTPFTLNSSDCQFTVDSDEDVEDQSANISDQFTGSQRTTNLQDTLPAPNFVVEDDSEVCSSNQDVTTIPPASFLLTPDDKGATSTIDSFPNVFISPHSSIESVSTMSSSEAPPSKKLKTSHDFELKEYEFQVKRLEQQLEFAIKDKELNNQQIDGLREQIIVINEKEKKNSIEMDELKIKIARLEEQNAITKKSNDDINKKLLELTEEKIDLERQLVQKKAEWEERLSKELKNKDDQHAQTMFNKVNEIMSLNKQLKDNDRRYQKLKQSHNTVVSKYQHLKKSFLSILQDISDDNSISSEDKNTINNNN